MKTCWDNYYQKPAFFSKFTRRLTSSWLKKNIIKHSPHKIVSIAEFGGGNSLFFTSMASCNQIKISNYTIYDNNKLGIDMFIDRHREQKNILAVEADLLNYDLPENFYDIVFSIGLIEHFSLQDTKKLILQHFKATKKGGIVIATAPTPTLIYSIVRKFAEMISVWKFHDERPLLPHEIRNTSRAFGDILYEQILYFTILTQYAIIIKKS